MPFIHLNLSYIIIKIYDLWIIGLATYNQPSIIISDARKKSHRQMKFSDKTRMREWWSLELKRPQRSATPAPLFYKWINWAPWNQRFLKGHKTRLFEGQGPVGLLAHESEAADLWQPKWNENQTVLAAAIHTLDRDAGLLEDTAAGS